MKNFIYIIFCFLLISCNAVRVNYDYDKATNFSNYTTYNYFSDIESGLSELDEKRLVKALDSALQAKGYLLAEEPDFFINILSNKSIQKFSYFMAFIMMTQMTQRDWLCLLFRLF